MLQNSSTDETDTEEENHFEHPPRSIPHSRCFRRHTDPFHEIENSVNSSRLGASTFSHAKHSCRLQYLAMNSKDSTLPLASKMKKSFYRRALPSPPAIAFGSQDGRQMFGEALAAGFMEGYFSLAEQFRTQDEPAYCGLSTLTMVLNSLAVDPGRIWKGPWRWYNEEMLDCCRPLEEVKEKGIEFHQLACLARCNGVNVTSKHCLTEKTGKRHTVEEFREDIQQVCATPHEPVMIVSYSRKAFEQTGDGHYSPIGGYHPDRDMALIFDVARFKYPPHWVPVPLLFESMHKVDSATNQGRGWMLLQPAPANVTLLFTFSKKFATQESFIEFPKLFFETLPRAFHQCEHAEDAACRRSARSAVACILANTPSSVCHMVATQADAFDVKLSDQHEMIKQRIFAALRQLPLHALVVESISRDDCVLNEIQCGGEILTLLVMICPDFIWQRLSDEVREEVYSLMQFDEQEYPELKHEIESLKNHLGALQLECECSGLGPSCG